MSGVLSEQEWDRLVEAIGDSEIALVVLPIVAEIKLNERKRVVQSYLALCEQWDRISKGESPTTRAIREVEVADA